jgi:hypothetical protein
MSGTGKGHSVNPRTSSVVVPSAEGSVLTAWRISTAHLARLALSICSLPVSSRSSLPLPKMATRPARSFFSQAAATAWAAASGVAKPCPSPSVLTLAAWLRTRSAAAPWPEAQETEGTV